MVFFQDASHQTLNSYEKTVIVHFDSYPLSVSVYPLPPLEIPIQEESHHATLKSVRAFAKKYQLKIVLQDVNSSTNTIQGLWLRNSKLLADVYIPTEPVTIIPNLSVAGPFTTPLILPIPEVPSTLGQWRYSRQVASVLREYALYTYARNPDDFSLANSFTVIPNHEYDLAELHGKLLSDTPVMYDGRRLIVPDTVVAQRLYDEVMTYVHQEPTEGSRLSSVMSYAHRHYLQHQPSDTQLVGHVFHQSDTMNTYLQNIRNNNTIKIHMEIIPKQEEVFCYGTFFLVGREVVDDRSRSRVLGPCWIQYSDSDSFQDAFHLVKHWAQYRVNAGYHAPGPILTSKIFEDWTIQIFQDFQRKWKIRGRGPLGALILEFKPKQYAAILPTPMPHYQ